VLYIQVVANTKKQNRVTKIEIKSPRTNSTFGFCQHTKYQPEKPKELFLAIAHRKD